MEPKEGEPLTTTESGAPVVPAVPVSNGDPNLAKKCERQQLAQAERYLRKELRRHALHERERLLAEVILEYSFALGKPSVRIPRMALFTDMTGIAKSHVLVALRGLAEMNVISVDREGPTYAVNPNSGQWKVRFKAARESIRRAGEIIKACNGLDGADPAVVASASASAGEEGAELNFKSEPDAQFLLFGGTAAVPVTREDTPFPELE
jgi:hypothetical protein